MKLLAIDPGPVQSAWVILDTGSKTILGHGITANYALKAAMQEEQAGRLVIEGVQSYGMAVGRSVFETVFWIGRFVEAWGRQFDLIYRSDVKACLCHDSRAKDTNIRAALIDMFGGSRKEAIGIKSAPGPLYGIKRDMWSALAVALTWVDTRKEKP